MRRHPGLRLSIWDRAPDGRQSPQSSDKNGLVARRVQPIFASARRADRQPCWLDSLLQKPVRPAAEEAGIAVPIGWHTFRRSFSSWLKSGGADVKVVQGLMRHANLRTTMDLYTQAPMGAKREAQRKIAEQIALART